MSNGDREWAWVQVQSNPKSSKDTTVSSWNFKCLSYKGKEGMEKEALSLEWLHPEVTHVTFSHVSFTKENHMFTKVKEQESAVLPSAQKETRTSNTGEQH